MRTTALLADRLRAAGLEPHLLPGSGLVCDVGPGPATTGRQRIALRADLDALPVVDTPACRGRRPPAASRTPAATTCTRPRCSARACCSRSSPTELTTGVRLLFQPAEEVQPGGALDVIAAGGLDGVGQIFAFHCDPKVDVGQVGTRIGPITSASDEVTSPSRAPGATRRART